MRFGSVCSGIEAASCAWHPLGWQAAWLSEIEPFPCAVLEHHYPSVPNLGDMTKIKEKINDGSVEAPEVFVGGTPCQAFSVAGLRGGLDDPRGGLTLEFVKIADAIDEKRREDGREPSIIVWENVTGVLSSKDNAFGCFLGALAGEKCELFPSGRKWSRAGCVFGEKRTIAWRTLDAQYFGVAQRRKRVFVVASAGRADPSQILFEFDGVRRDTPPSREAGEDTARCFEPRSPDGYARVTEGGVSPTLNTMGGGQREPCVFTTSSFGGYKDGFGTLRANGGDNGGWSESIIAFPSRLSGTQRATTEEISPSLCSKNETAVSNKTIVRRLTPTECERLQGFPDGYTQIPWRKKAKEECPDGNRYKALGNSMAVPVMAWIGERIQGAIK